jgi:hypothetical protein
MVRMLRLGMIVAVVTAGCGSMPQESGVADMAPDAIAQSIAACTGTSLGGQCFAMDICLPGTLLVDTREQHLCAPDQKCCLRFAAPDAGLGACEQQGGRCVWDDFPNPCLPNGPGWSLHADRSCPRVLFGVPSACCLPPTDGGATD